MEEVLQLMRQAQEDIAGSRRPGRGGRFQQGFHLIVIQGRDHRRGHHRHRDTGRAELFDRLQPAARAGRARLHPAGEFRVQRGQGNADAGEPQSGEFRDQVDVALDQRRLAQEAHRVAELGEDFQQAPRQPQPFLHRLVGIGVDPQGDDARHIAGARELAAQKLRPVGLEEQLALEIEPRRQAVIGMAGPRETVDAAMLAAAIGIDRPVEMDVRRAVEGDDGARGLAGQLGAQGRRGVLHRVPAIIEIAAAFRFVAPGGVGDGAAPAMVEPLGRLGQLLARHAPMPGQFLLDLDELCHGRIKSMPQ